jgi:hypothetical protein
VQSSIYIPKTKMTQTLRRIDGDENAFSILFKTLCASHSLVSLSFRFLKKVQDCVQDVFTDIWVYRAKLNDDVVVKAYCLAFAKNYKIKIETEFYI